MQKLASAEQPLSEKVKHLEQRITATERRLQELKTARINLLRKTLLFCPACETNSEIGQWTFNQVHHYIKPHGCDEGDYWVPSNIEVCFFVCPNCKKESYIYRHPQKMEISNLAEKVFNVHLLFNSVCNIHQ